MYYLQQTARKDRRTLWCLDRLSYVIATREKKTEAGSPSVMGNWFVVCNALAPSVDSMIPFTRRSTQNYHNQYFACAVSSTRQLIIDPQVQPRSFQRDKHAYTHYDRHTRNQLSRVTNTHHRTIVLQLSSKSAKWLWIDKTVCKTGWHLIKHTSCESLRGLDVLHDVSVSTFSQRFVIFSKLSERELAMLPCFHNHIFLHKKWRLFFCDDTHTQSLPARYNITTTSTTSRRAIRATRASASENTATPPRSPVDRATPPRIPTQPTPCVKYGELIL